MSNFAEKYIEYLELEKDLFSIFRSKQILAQENFLYDDKKRKYTKGGVEIKIKGCLYYEASTRNINSYHKELLNIEEVYNDFKERLLDLGFEVKED